MANAAALDGAVHALAALPLVLMRLLPEELVFRGYALHSARRLFCPRAAIVISALGFGAYHLIGTRYWGAGALFVFLTSALGGLLFAWAMLRTRGMALSIGLHLGGNWLTACVVVLGDAPTEAIWRAPLDAVQVNALTAPEVLKHLPYLTALLVLFAIVAAMPSASGGHAVEVR